MTELLASHDLFFGSSDSQKDAETLGTAIDFKILSDYREKWAGTHGCPQLSDFPIYGHRLLDIHQRMKDWRPIRFLDLRFRPYNDPLPHFAFWFAVIFGVVTVIGLALNIAQIVITTRQCKTS